MSLYLDSVQIEQSARLVRIESCIQAASSAWFIYDYILTIPDEIRCIWWRQFSSVKLIFILLRYAALASTWLRSSQSLTNWNMFADGGASECQVAWKLNTTIGIVFYISFSVLMALRVYAITGRGTKAFLSVFSLSMVFVCCIAFNDFIGTALPRPWLPGCYQIYVLDGHLGVFGGIKTVLNAGHAVISISGMCCLFIAEVLNEMGTKKSLAFLLLRDGTVAWVTVSISAILCGVVTSHDLTPFTIPCMSIVGCRVIMRLRQAGLSDSVDHSSDTKSWLSARFIGNVGAPLDFADHSEDHNDEEDDDDLVAHVDGNTLAAGLEDACRGDHRCV